MRSTALKKPSKRTSRTENTFEQNFKQFTDFTTYRFLKLLGFSFRELAA